MVHIEESIEFVGAENKKYERIFPLFKELYLMLTPALQKLVLLETDELKLKNKHFFKRYLKIYFLLKERKKNG